MEILRKFFIFVGGVMVIYMAACFIGGAIAGGWTVVNLGQGMDQGRAREAGFQFVVAYRPAIFAGSCVLSAAIAFGSRFGGWLFALPLAFFGFVVLSKSGEAVKSSGYVPGGDWRSVAMGDAGSRSRTQNRLQAGQRAILLLPVAIDIPNGRVTLPKGSSVLILADRGEQTEVQWINGTRFTVATEQLQPSR